MSDNRPGYDGRAVHELGANGNIHQPRPDIEDRYAVVPTVFAVLDKHTGQPVGVS